MIGYKKLNKVSALRHAQGVSVGVDEAYALQGERATRVAQLVSLVEARYGVTFYIIPPDKVNWGIFPRRAEEVKDPYRLYTGSILTDAVYEARGVYISALSLLENVVHECAHILIADPQDLERVNYNTCHRQFPSYRTPQTTRFVEHAHAQEGLACEAEVVFYMKEGWPDVRERALDLNSVETLKDVPTIQAMTQAWETLGWVFPSSR
jgi:hypothetical protein